MEHTLTSLKSSSQLPHLLLMRCALHLAAPSAAFPFSVKKKNLTILSACLALRLVASSFSAVSLSSSIRAARRSRFTRRDWRPFLAPPPSSYMPRVSPSTGCMSFLEIRDEGVRFGELGGKTHDDDDDPGVCEGGSER